MRKCFLKWGKKKAENLAGKIWRCVLPPSLTGNALAVAKDTVIKAPEAKPKRRKLGKICFVFIWGVIHTKA